MLHPENTLGKTDREAGPDRKMDFKVIKTHLDLQLRNQKSVMIKKEDA